MKLATIALVRPPKVDAQQLGEITLRSFGAFVNDGRQGDDYILISLLLIEDLGQLKGHPDVTMIVACGNHSATRQVGDMYFFRSINDMQKGVVEVLQRRFPVAVPHPELELAHADGQSRATQIGGD